MRGVPDGAALLTFWLALCGPLRGQNVNHGMNPGIDALLGRGGREAHRQRIEAARPGGKARTWNEYAAWGRELVLTACVQSPPIGQGPSKPLSEFYRCTHCHNLEREDPVLTVQDPEARAAWISAKSRGGDAPILLAPGTTLWGAVNREQFYNDSYEIYHFLKNAADREMDPKSLEDAIQICCRFCSVGRYAETWEIDSLLAYLWEKEVKLLDLDLPKPIAHEVTRTLNGDPSVSDDDIRRTRDFLRRQFLVRAGDTYTAGPEKHERGELVGPYPDKAEYRGDPEIGGRLYALACDQCHGPEKPNELRGSTLVRDLRKFHRILSHGTAHDDAPYMPMFTSQRLSRQQIADIQAHLLSLSAKAAP